MRIILPESRFISHISFKEKEIGGNFGSNGLVLIDDEVMNQQFGRYPFDDNFEEPGFHNRTFTVNRTASILEIRVTQITDESEIVIDDLQIFEAVPTSQSFFTELTIETVEIDLRNAPNTDAFTLTGSVLLGPDSNGVNFIAEDVLLTIGDASIVLPAGFLADEAGTFVFTGPLDGSNIDIRMTPTGPNAFNFSIGASLFELTGFMNPLTIGLKIGDDGGEEVVQLEGDLSNMIPLVGSNPVNAHVNNYWYVSSK